jgi:hypothetical protein
MICKTRLSITGVGLPVRLSGSNTPSSSTRLLDENDETPDPSNKGVALLVETTDNDRGPVDDWDVDWDVALRCLCETAVCACIDPEMEVFEAFPGAELVPSKGVTDVLRLWVLATEVLNEV